MEGDSIESTMGFPAFPLFFPDPAIGTLDKVLAISGCLLLDGGT